MELVHTASLILDDLPAMDDAPLRRGRAGQSRRVRRSDRDPGRIRPAQPRVRRRCARAMSRRCRRAWPRCSTRRSAQMGLIGGQAADLLATEQEIGFELLERIHRGKTGALFNASAVAGAMTAGADAESIARSPPLPRTSASRSRSSTTCSTSRAIRRRQARRRARTRERRRSSRSAASPARTSSPTELCQTADRALTPFGRRADRLRELSAFVAAARV